MKLMVNELQYVESLIKNKNLSTKVNRDIRLLAKYYYGEGYTDRESLFSVITQLLDECLGKKNNWEVQIKKNVDTYIDTVRDKGYIPLKNITKVDIYKHELEVIESLDDKKKQKLLFAILVYLKLTNTNYLPYEAIREARTLTNINKLTIVKAEEMVNELLKVEYQSEKILRGVNAQKVAVICTFTQSEGEIAFSMTDLSEEGIALYYEQVLGEKVKECVECGKLILVGKTKPKKYCEKCAKTTQLVQINKSKQNRRARNGRIENGENDNL